MPFESLLNPGKGECTSVLKWRGITLKEFDFGIFEYFLIKFLQRQSRYFLDHEEKHQSHPFFFHLLHCILQGGQEIFPIC